MIGDYSLGPDTVYPQSAAIACEILEQWRNVWGRDLVRITTDKPWSIESTEGVSEFVVLASQVISAQETIVELESQIRRDEERLKTAPDRSATAMRLGVKTRKECITAGKNGHWR